MGAVGGRGRQRCVADSEAVADVGVVEGAGAAAELLVAVLEAPRASKTLASRTIAPTRGAPIGASR
jgi:hypothetical protein